MARKYSRRRASSLKRTPGHLRLDLDADPDIRELGRSYLKRPLYPIIIRPDGTILDGNRRVAGALLEAGDDAEVDVCETDEEVTPSAIIEIQLESSLHHNGLSAYEQFCGFSEWLRLNPSAAIKDLAQRIHRNPSTLTRILSLSRCTPAVQEVAKRGDVGPSEWYAMAKEPADRQAEMLAAHQNGASRDALEAERRERRIGNTTADTVKATSIKITLPNRVTVIVKGQAISLKGAVEALKTARDEADKARSQGLDIKTAQAVWRNKADAVPSVGE
jgi:hypothetical protein